MPFATGNENESLIALVDGKWVAIRGMIPLRVSGSVGIAGCGSSSPVQLARCGDRGCLAVLAAARLAGPWHDERLRDEALAVADRLRTVAEKLERFGPAQRAFALTFAAADADAARLIAGFPDAGHPAGRWGTL